ncbi:MAG: tRNA (adenosine(37)-N6)-threonylcarbamoyltransferase complex dimerization subunit type 1 TsaB [Rhabdochlamydiaceae bacterium]|nr:tRNA (adenosine(37)-N6)-threonylcarbamoyltransferase complex dimerization subunit type 1 TsaB [Candidatus Amphrikana amoebophyrae]
MITLLIDTSSNCNVIAIFQNGDIIAHSLFNSKSNQLICEIDALLKKCQLNKSDIEKIAIGTGPGSFTGTRIGVIVAKSMNFALNIPLAPFNSMALYIPQCKAGFTLLRDAKSGQFYQLSGKWENNSLSLDSPSLINEASEDVMCDDLPINFNAIISLINNVKPLTHKEITISYLKNP